MYFSINDKQWVIDIEGDSLSATKIWCLCAVNVKTGEEWESNNPVEIAKWINARKTEGCKFVGHNIIGYDAPTLNRLLGTTLTISDLIDTFLLSMLYSPGLVGGHSLEDWGRRLRILKGSFSDFSKFSPEMLAYCRQDVRLTRRVYVELVRRMLKAGFSEFGLYLEHRSWFLIQKQKKNGFAFNIQEAHILYAKLRQLETEIGNRVHVIWPPTLSRTATYRRPYRKDGQPSSNFTRHCQEYERVDVRREEDEYDCYELVAFNIGSPDQRVEKLVELGWQPLPSERTPTGRPKPTVKGKLVPSLEKFVEESGQEGPRLIAQWMDVNARANNINTWIEAYNETTGCIHGSLWLANTLRYRHSNPNTANIPAVRLNKQDEPLRGLEGVYTYEARDLWVTRDPIKRRLVGVDAKGIQLRVLAHYLNNPTFTEAVINGDPHSYNQEIGGFRTRAIAKTFIYAFLLGAGDEKVGQIISGSPKDGREVKQRFIGNFPGLAQLLDSLAKQIDRTGRIRLVDGTPIVVTEPHARLGYLLQGDENRIMKLSAILVDERVRKEKLDVLKVGDIHDEWQSDVLLKHVEPFILACKESFPLSGKQFNYNVPIACDAKLGLTWAETH